LTYIALIAGFGSLSFWLVAGQHYEFAVERMVTLMVIACPHALGLAVPLVVAVGTALSAGSGLLIRDRSAHPIALGIIAAAMEHRNITGEGIIAVVEGQEIRIVSPGHLAR
jgi:Cu2+-exporting ATPase